IVVSGLPRSGTSMAMKMLAAGGVPILSDGRRRADEDNPEGYFELEIVKTLSEAGDTSWLDHAAGKAVKIISYHLRFLPHGTPYEVIFMRRRLGEILASQDVMLARRGEAEDPNAGTLSPAYRDHLIHVQTILRLRPELRVLELWYHDVVENPLGAAREIAAFLDRRLDVEAMARAVNPSLYRQRLEDTRDC
ncbi:MAG: sulfotransferase domain-containing protein, partial [Acidobacteria bacterium]|nr:sulfotransferase domain-containing protein [Acidobacteriota bacterium]